MTPEAKAELKATLDASIKENLEGIVGKEIAERVGAVVRKMRFDQATTGRDASGLDNDVKLAFVKDVRSIARGEKAAYLGNSDQAGGYLIPTELHEGIIRIAATTGLIMRDARRFPMSSDQLDIPRYTGAVMQGSYVGEDTAGSETQTDIGDAKLIAKQWMNIFRISNILIQDANINVADWLLALAAEGLAYRIDREGFTGGTFVGSPFVGLLASADVTVQTMATGKTGFDKFDVTEASDAIGAVPTAALADAAFYFHRTVWAKLKGKKDATSGLYEFSQQNSTLVRFLKENGINPVGVIDEYPVFTTDVLPPFSDSAVSTKFGIFGNLSLALAIGDRGPMEVSKSDAAVVGGVSVFERNQTALRVTHRHAVSIALPAAAVVLKTSAS